jgi:hypothetical protein
MGNDLTGKLRIVNATLLACVVLTGLVGWLGWEMDPMDLLPLLGPLTANAAVGEASNVGKRATFDPDAV